MATMETTTWYDSGNITTYDNNTSNSTFCQGTMSIEKNFVNLGVLPALLVVILLSFFKRRKTLCLSCCGGRPAIAYPVNFVDEHERRWAYAAAFGIITYKIMLLFDGEYYYAPEEFKDPVWMSKYSFVKVFIQIINVLQVGLVFYPLFVCIVYRRNIIANIIGFLYGGLWFSISLLSIISCSAQNFAMNYLLARDSSAVDAAFYVPVFICYVILLICYVIDFCINIRNICTKRAKSEDVFGSSKSMKDTNPTRYVRMLLQRTKKQKTEKMGTKIKEKLKYVIVPGLKYSPRVLCTMVVAGFALFKAAIELGYGLDRLMKYIIILSEVYGKGLLENVADNDTTIIFDRVIEGLFIVRVSLMVCNGVSVLLHAIFMILMVINYRRHLRQYILGQRTWHYNIKQSPSSALVGSMRYSGYQIAFIIYGWFIFMLFLFLVISIVTFLIALPLRDGYSTFLISKIQAIWPTLVVSFVIMILQRLAVRFFFLQDKGQYMALENRRWYHVVSYFLFFFNVLLGLFSALRRILISMIAGIVLLSRLDRTLMMRGFERFDSGFNAYLGMLETELYHTHPIISFFIECLQEGARERRLREEKRQKLSEEDIGLMELRHRRQILRNKWYKAITLINNPMILVERLNTLVKQHNLSDPVNAQDQMVAVLDQAHQLMGNSSAPSEKVTSLYRSRYRPTPVPSVPAYVPYIPDSTYGEIDETSSKTSNIPDKPHNNTLYPHIEDDKVKYRVNHAFENDMGDTRL